jgi:LPS-assembly protein
LVENDIVTKSLTPAGRAAYRDLARFRLFQSFDIKEAQRELIGPDDERRPFSNIRGELEFYPLPRIALIVDTAFNPYDTEFRTINTYFRASDRRGDRLQLDYRFTKDSVEEFNARLDWQLSDRLSFLGFSKTSLSGNKNIEAGVGLGVRFQCWGMRFLYKGGSDESSVGITFSLSGIGDIQTLSLDL